MIKKVFDINSKIDYSLSDIEEKFYNFNKNFIDVVVNAYDIIKHSEVAEQNGNIKSALLILENSIGKELIQKLIYKKFWEV